MPLWIGGRTLLQRWAGLADESEMLKYGVNVRLLSNTDEASGVEDSAGRLSLMRMQMHDSTPLIRSSKYCINQLSLAPY
jgi:hypothetical protein